jgi:hypothetical protein
MRATISSGIGSLPSVMASHVRRCTISRADALFHLSPRIQAGVRTHSGEERNIYGTYLAHFGALSASGTIALQPTGQLTFTMESGSGPLGPTDASSTATLYDRGGKRVLVGNGRIGFYQTPFSYELTEQK